MKNFLILFCLTCCCFSNVSAAKPNAKKILREGEFLCRLERASWSAADLLMSRDDANDITERIGGYVSYETRQGGVTTVFYEKGNPDVIILSYHFDNKAERLLFSMENSPATTQEQELIHMRNTVSDMMNSADSFYQPYENTKPNLIPVIYNNKKKVYVLTAPTQAGVILLGNDYMVTFGKKGNVKSQDKIHNSLIAISARSEDPDNPIIGSMHSHVKSETIDPTDICTLLLYRDYTDWKTHYVISSEYVSILDMQTPGLVIMKKSDWDNMNSPQSNGQ